MIQKKKTLLHRDNMKINGTLKKLRLEKENGPLPGFELGVNIRKNVNEKLLLTGNILNDWQLKIGIKATSIIVVLIWSAAFIYFLLILLNVITKK